MSRETTITPADIKALSPQVRARAAQVMLENELLRQDLQTYQESVLAISEYTFQLYQGLYEGIDPRTGESLAPTQFLPLLKTYIETAILKAKTKIKTSYNAADFEEANQSLIYFESIQAKGITGLIEFCLETSEKFPRNQHSGELSSFWKPHQQRWLDYASLLGQTGNHLPE